MKKLFIILVFFTTLLCVHLTHASKSDSGNQLVTRFSIFPLAVPNAYLDIADEAWWEVRKKVTRSKKYLVGSKKFMQLKGVFQPRQQLEPADAIILGRLLDAHALVTIHLNSRLLSFNAYEGKTGRTLWQDKVTLHPAIPVKEQLISAVGKIVDQFLSDIPYHGYVIKDDLIGKVVYQREGRKFVKVNVGSDSQLSAGEKVQFFQLKSINNSNVYQGGAKYEVFAEGKIESIDLPIAEVELVRMADKQSLEAGSLLQAPNEYRRVKSQLRDKGVTELKVNPYLTQVNMTDVNQEQEGSALSALVFIGGLVGFLLLAF